MKSYEKDAADLERLELIREVYNHVYLVTESFNGPIGRDLAYLLGAIARGEQCGGVDFPHASRIIRVLRGRYGKGHAVWRYISVDGKRPVEAS